MRALGGLERSAIESLAQPAARPERCWRPGAGPSERLLAVLGAVGAPVAVRTLHRWACVGYERGDVELARLLASHRIELVGRSTSLADAVVRVSAER